jgi:hypothetical protein
MKMMIIDVLHIEHKYENNLSNLYASLNSISHSILL